MPNHLWDSFPALAGASDAPFIVNPDGAAISYRAAAAATGRIGAVLIAHGVAPGDRVVVQAEKSPAVILLYLACVRIGAVLVPLNTAYTLAELDHFLSDARPALIVCRPADAGAVGDLAARLGLSAPLTLGEAGEGTLPSRAADIQAAPLVDRAADCIAAILYTSGTTGRPKGAMLSHANLGSNAATLAQSWAFSADDVLLHALPVFHTHGLFVATNTTLIAGSSMLFLPKFDADEIFRLMPRATVMMGVPTFYVRLAGDPRLTREATAGMRLYVSGSAPLLAETHRRFEAACGHRILERYGMTETNMNTSNPYRGERRPGTVGPALPGVDVRVVNEASALPVPQGEIGMVEVRGPNVFSGYWGMPEKTALDFRADGFFVTGDLGVLDADGYLTIAGRGKDLVISGGYNVYPAEVEAAIDAVAGVRECAVIGVPHPDLGEVPVAVVVADGDVDAERIIATLKHRLARFKQPRHVVFVDELPRNSMAKVQKQLLRERYTGLFSGDASPSDAAA